MGLGKEVQRLRIQAQIDVTEVAKETGLFLNYLTNIELEREPPSEYALEKIIEYFRYRGVAEEDLKRLKPVRIATVPTGAYWEVKLDDGGHLNLEEHQIVEAVMTNIIKPDHECRHFSAPDENGKRRISKWKKVSVSLARSAFAIRVLFQPVWAHTVRGAEIGAAIGIIFWLACGVFFFVIQGVNLAAGVVFAVFLYGWCQVLLPKRLQTKTEGFIGKVLLAGLLALGFSASRVGLGETLKGVFFVGFQAQIGAHLAGALAGVFPGMILGTLVGLARQGKLRRAATAQPENRMAVVVKGLIIPSVLVVCVAALYITFMPKLAEYAAGNLK
jgi:transcriptional regulator with XRE-family HTH domain